MLGSHVTKDFQGIILLNRFLLPMLKEKKLLNKVKINLIMRTNKKILPEIKNILKNKHLNLCQYTKNNINNMLNSFF